MALDDVALNLGRVTGCEVRWYSQALPDSCKIGRFIDRHDEASSLQMPNPAITASTIRILVDDDAWTLGEGGRRRHDDQCRRRQSKRTSSRQTT